MKETDAEGQSKKARPKKGCMIGVISVIVMAAILIGLSLVLVRGIPKTIRNPSMYETLLSDRKNLRTGFVVFPPQIPESGLENAPEFYYYYRSDVFDPIAEVFLRCTYSEADYRAELDRLEHYVHQLGAERTSETYEPQCFLKDERGLFSYPAYIAILADDYAYEYALLTGEREITYIYFAFRQPGEFRAVPKDCLPDPFEGSLHRDSGMYNMYVFQDHCSTNYIYTEYDRSDGS